MLLQKKKKNHLVKWELYTPHERAQIGDKLDWDEDFWNCTKLLSAIKFSTKNFRKLAFQYILQFQDEVELAESATPTFTIYRSRVTNNISKGISNSYTFSHLCTVTPKAAHPLKFFSPLSSKIKKEWRRLTFWSVVLVIFTLLSLNIFLSKKLQYFLTLFA